MGSRFCRRLTITSHKPTSVTDDIAVSAAPHGRRFKLRTTAIYLGRVWFESRVQSTVYEAPICTVTVVVRCVEPDVAVTVTVDVTGGVCFAEEPHPPSAIDPMASATASDSH